MPIPEITRANVLSAINHIRKNGVPTRRRSTRYCLVHDGRRYPPKYVVSLAVKSATGRALDPQGFGGGVETNSLLRRLGFSVGEFKQGDAATRRQPPAYSRTKRRQKVETDKVTESAKTAARASLIGRGVVRGQSGDPKDGEAILLDVLTKQWPKGLRLKFLITPGGFVVGDFPTSWSGGIGWNSKTTDLKDLKKHASPTLSRTVTNRVLKAAAGKVDVLTIGIDLYSDERQERYEHAELVAIYEIASRRVFWTGKSYPTIGQERDLVQVVDLRTHLQRLAGERVLVLGCHDLNMFRPRARARQKSRGVRRQRCVRMRKIVHRFKPTIVLHHPHGTDSPNIWRTAWGGLTREQQHLQAWASGIGYYNIWGDPIRASLKKVRAGTQGGSKVLDWTCSYRLACRCSFED